MSYSNDGARVMSSDTKPFSVTNTGTAIPKSATARSLSGSIGDKLRVSLQFAAFVFSHVGLGFLVLVYTVLGAFLFKHFEEPAVSQTTTHIADIRNDTVNKLWTETYKLNVLYKENWTAMAVKEIEHFQRVLVKALKDGYSPIDENKFYSRWSFTDSWMYSISIITTIGSASRPATAEGKIATMIYAVVGIPIMLLFLSTIGSLLGNGLKSLYKFCCMCTNDSHNSLIELSSGVAHQAETLQTQQQHQHQQQHNHQLHHHHHHHHHRIEDDYQVNHIPLQCINGTGHLVMSCDTATHAFVAKDVPMINANSFEPPPPRCSYETEFVELDAETKLCAEPVEHLCANDKHTQFDMLNNHHQPCTRYLVGMSTPTLYRECAPCRNPTSACNIAGTDNSMFGEETSCRMETVPIYFCFLLVVLYMLSGAFMFYVWEGCSILDGTYFCFVTLSTIGFGDIVPEKTLLSSSQSESRKRIILVVLYVLGGMTLIAMSFNIIYEQLAFKLRNFGARFQLRGERSYGGGGNGRDIKIVSNKFINSAEDIDV